MVDVPEDALFATKQFCLGPFGAIVVGARYSNSLMGADYLVCVKELVRHQSVVDEPMSIAGGSWKRTAHRARSVFFGLQSEPSSQERGSRSKR